MSDDEYIHTPDDGHDHEFEWEPGLPDTGVSGMVTVICIHCGMLSCEGNEA